MTGQLKKSLFFLLYLPFLLSPTASAQPAASFSTDSFTLDIDDSGSVTSLVDNAIGRNFASADSVSFLLSVRRSGQWFRPTRMAANPEEELLQITFQDGNRATVRVTQHPTHLSLELVDLDDHESAEIVCWGPYSTTLNETIGETVGVVQGDGFALGLQALNPKTLGGYPWNENDTMPQLDIFESGDYSDLSEEGKRYVLYRVEAAIPTDFGSTLQAYTRNRNRDRVIENWGQPAYVAPEFDDGGLIGSRIALFGVPQQQALMTIGEIEKEEGLPHPTIDGTWTKMHPGASAAYLILEFGQDTFDRALELTEKAGLNYLYHPEPFRTWGHFPLREEFFPDGVRSLAAMVDSAEARGVHLGLHTLSNFITTSDEYVTPFPDPRLAVVGSTTLTSPVTSSQTEIAVADVTFIDSDTNNNLRTIRIGDELIRYGRISGGPPWVLTECTRGAFGTAPNDHASGDTVSRLADHGYKVFLTNPALSIEVARNIAGVYNKSGVRQISFDGLEGNRSTGMGNYGEILFTNAWYEALNPDIRAHFIADASRTSHYFWHLYTRMNWGEPWYAGFRESQTEYRLKNQAYFRRNLMPGMLGWFRMTPETTIQDTEWMLARSAAFDAGYAFVTSFDAVEKNARTDRILHLIGSWERARMFGAFTPEQKRAMEDIRNEFELEEIDSTTWRLTPVESLKFRHQNRAWQPGEPPISTFEIDNASGDRPLSFILVADKVSATDIVLEVDHSRSINLPFNLNSGDSINWDGATMVHANAFGEALDSWTVHSENVAIEPGRHTLRLQARLSGDADGALKLEIRMAGPAEVISATK